MALLCIKSFLSMSPVVLFLILRGRFKSFNGEDDVSCGSVIHGLHYVEVLSFYFKLAEIFVKC